MLWSVTAREIINFKTGIVECYVSVTLMPTAMRKGSDA